MMVVIIIRTLNGFLNTGQGGTVYLGVLNDGTVNGIAMSVFQVSEQPLDCNLRLQFPIALRVMHVNI